MSAPALDDAPERARRWSRARLTKRVFEVDPLHRRQYEIEMWSLLDGTSVGLGAFSETHIRELGINVASPRWECNG